MSLYNNLKQHKFYFIYAVIVSMIFGIYLHVSAIVFGKDLVLQHFFTPAVDMFLAIFITWGAIGLISYRKSMYLPNLFIKIVYYFATVLFTLSIPVHAYTFFSQSTEYIRYFPLWYSYAETPIFIIILMVFLNLKTTSAGEL
jgi:hypothetical protein